MEDTPHAAHPFALPSSLSRPTSPHTCTGPTGPNWAPASTCHPSSTLPECQWSCQELNLIFQSCCLKPQCSPAPRRARNTPSKASEFCREGPPPALQTCRVLHGLYTPMNFKKSICPCDSEGQENKDRVSFPGTQEELKEQAGASIPEPSHTHSSDLPTGLTGQEGWTKKGKPRALQQTPGCRPLHDSGRRVPLHVLS